MPRILNVYITSFLVLTGLMLLSSCEADLKVKTNAASLDCAALTDDTYCIKVRSGQIDSVKDLALVQDTILTRASGFDLSWKMPETAKGILATKIMLASDAACTEEVKSAELDIKEQVYTFTDIKDGIYYGCVFAKARAAGLLAAKNNGIRIVVDTTPPSAPSAITVAAFTNTTSVSASYTAGTDVNFSTHNVKACAASDCNTGCLSVSQEIASRVSLSSLVNGSSYYVCIQSLDLAGNSSSYVPSGNSVTIDNTKPTAPAAVTVPAFSSTANVSVSFTGGTDLNFSTHNLKACTASDCSTGCLSATQDTASPATVSSLVSGTAYYACLQTVDLASNTSAWIASIGTVTLDTAAPVVNLGPSRRAGNSFHLRPSITDSSPVSYQWSQLSGPGTLTFTTPTSAEPLVTADIEGDYTLQLVAVDAVGHSTTSTVALRWDRTLALQLGRHDSCAIYAQGKVRCWGRNSGGALGTGELFMHNSPLAAAIDLGGNYEALSVAVMAFGACALLDSGEVKCWPVNVGNNAFNASPASISPIDLGTGRRSVAISTGYSHTCAILDDGGVVCWGANTNGQLGYGDTAARNGIANPPKVNLGNGAKAIEIATADFSTCVLLDSNQVKCWGLNTLGQLGYGDTTQRNEPPATTIDFGGLTVKSLPRGGSAHFCAILSDNSLKCWGANSDGRLGDGTTTSPRSSPVAVAALGGTPQKVAVGSTSTCALLSGGTVKCWGGNSNGQLGYGDTTARSAPPATSLDFGSGRSALAIALGRSGSWACALLDDLSIKCWGDNSYGQLGYGDADYVYQTGALNFSGSPNAVKTVTASSHACTLFNDGSVKCWGSNANGQLGIGSTIDQSPSSTSAVNLGAAATDITVWDNYSCAILSGGSVKCWGTNTRGSIGDGTSSVTPVDNLSPVAVRGLSAPVISLAITANYACAVLTGGAVKCWGNNALALGQLGVGTTSAANFCSDGVTAQASCTGALTWSSNLYGDCSNGMSISQTSCTAFADGAWTHCSNGQSADSNDCSLAGGTWNTALYNYCTNSSGLRKASEFCADEGGYWSNFGYCSNPSYRNRSDCIAAAANWAVTTIPSGSVDLGGIAATKVVVSNGSSCALLSNGTVRCWGKNTNTLLGSGSTDTNLIAASPNPPIDFGARTVKDIASGFQNIMVILDDNSFRNWGRSRFGYSNIADSLAAPLSSGPDLGGGQTFKFIGPSTHNNAIAFISSSNNIYIYGNSGLTYDNNYSNSVDYNYQLLTFDTAASPVNVAVGTSAPTLCATFADGTVRCAGYNNKGQAGPTPAPLRLAPPATVVTSIAQ